MPARLRLALWCAAVAVAGVFCALAFRSAGGADAQHTLLAAGQSTISTALGATVLDAGLGGHDGHDPTGHETLAGPVLVTDASPDAAQKAPTSKQGCPSGSHVRGYDVVAVAVDITLNRYGDHDPLGRAFVLRQDLFRLRAEEAAAKAQRQPGLLTGPNLGSPITSVSLGLQGDAIQPLTLRVLPGECLKLTLDDQIPAEPASLHLHGAALRVADNGRPATAAEPTATARPGQPVTYVWAVPANEPEGAHYFHSHGDERNQTEHGLYGSVVVEPAGSRWLDPRTDQPETSGWDAVVVRGDGTSFREFALYYAEVGNEPYQPLTRTGAQIPLVDDLSGAYKPAGRAISYRSEPFYDRLLLAKKAGVALDKSGTYSSYAFGDPATPMMRSYVGDPVIQRVVHAGSEVFHVHHVHGGSIRWRRQLGVGDGGANLGLTKSPPLLPGPSERTDSQSIGPGESFDVIDECGSGGCQQSTGDFLYHCHVAHHYFAGMWGLWRVYGTVQDGAGSTDQLAPLPELPDRRGHTPRGVTASTLLGTTVDLAGHPTLMTPAILDSWLGRVLPPPGQPRGYDAAVWDWRRSGADVLGEPADPRTWPGWTAVTGSARPQVLFDPRTGIPAYPFLRPHLGHRPPFAPAHGPAPALDPAQGTALPAPGANGPRSLCPTGTSLVSMPLQAITLPITLSPHTGIVDPFGEIFVLASQAAQARRDPKLARPLTLRTRAQKDCIDLTLVSALNDTPVGGEITAGVSKVDLHVHFMQFDVQASDGVVAGFNYEQSVRPFAVTGSQLTQAAGAGSSVLAVADTSRWQVGEVLGAGMDSPLGPEAVRVAAVAPGSLTLSAPLTRSHPAGDWVSAEFVRYRWYPDAQFGTTYFHDHVNGLVSWRHGLVGAIVAEPPDATWTDPVTGAPVVSGPLADVHTRLPVGVDLHGSFREFITLLEDDNPLTSGNVSTGGSLGLRVEPLAPRSSNGPSQLYATRSGGLPATAVVSAYVGDPVVFRSLVPATNEQHTFHIDGHGFRIEPWSSTSPVVDTVHLGISERYDAMVPAAGGGGHRPGDYLFGDGRPSKQAEGLWGLLRVLPGPVGPTLRALPGFDSPAPATLQGSVCPPGAPVRAVGVSAASAHLAMLGGSLGGVFIPDALVGELQAGRIRPEPLVLHVAVGDCLRLTLTNRLPSGRVSIRPGLLVSDPGNGAGIAAGAEPDQSVGPGGFRTVDLYASPEIGETTALLRDGGDPLAGPASGLYGAVVVAPRGATFHDPHSGARLGPGAPGTQVVVRVPGQGSYRDGAVFLQDSDGELGTHQMPYRKNLVGLQGLSYQLAPLSERAGGDSSDVFRSAVHGDPPTPLLEGFAGDAYRLHVLAPVSEQAQVFAVEGHRWPLEPGRRGTTVVSAVQVGALEAITLQLSSGGAHGGLGPAADYVYGDHRGPYVDAGMWGILRVHPRGNSATILPLSCANRGSCHLHSALVTGLGVVVVLALVVGGFLGFRRRRGRGGAGA